MAIRKVWVSIFANPAKARQPNTGMDPLNENDEIQPIQFKVGNRVVSDPIFHRLSRELAYARVRARLLQRVVAKRMGTTTRIRLVHPDDEWCRELSALARKRIGEPHEIGDR